MANHEQSAEDVFAEALELPPGERSAYLIRACKGSPELRAMVQDLLRDYQRMGDFIDESPVSGEAPAADLRETSAKLPVGSRLGRYTISQPLGTGGMGTVYRARDGKLERDVAIKILSPGVLTNEETRKRFRREALALGKLSHSHIAAVYDVGEQDGVDYLVMECVPGETLSAKVRNGPLPVQEATSILLQIAQALEDAHEQGVIHRDLKPSNVMITPKGNVKVLDFGIAKLLEPLAGGSILETGAVAGTPLYMSPEQAQGKSVDARTDLWSLGAVYYELLTGRTPFTGGNALHVMYEILTSPPTPVRDLRPDAPPQACKMVERALAKEPADRYQSAAELAQDASALIASYSTQLAPVARPVSRWVRAGAVLGAVAVLLAIGLSYHRYARKRWALDEAAPKVAELTGQNKPIAALLLAEQARSYAPDDPHLKALVDGNSRKISVTSTPSNATISIQDYLTPEGPWHTLGVTPLTNIQIPNGYFRWKVSKPGVGEEVVAPITRAAMDFDLTSTLTAPPGMVSVPGGTWSQFIAFVGWQGPYKLPPFYLDRLEVTNRDFQKFVDNGGYEKEDYWPETFTGGGRTLSRAQAMAEFRDSTDRPGPSTWVAGHYPEGKGDLPVAGVSWFEASAYASFAGKQLPILAQWFKASPSDTARYTIPLSNINGQAIAAAGQYNGLVTFGALDMVGNVREWSATQVDDGLRFIPGGSWKSPSYLATVPEAASPFDRSDTNGFRCVRNSAPLSADATTPWRRMRRDFVHYKPASDSVFEAYKALYAYPNAPLNATQDGVLRETADWREEKVTYDTGYRGERMSAYLFLPKHVRPPFQTVIFFPSARVYSYYNSDGGRELGDLGFFDYILQSGRAVLYPIYENTYERKIHYTLPSGAQQIQNTTDWYKDTARSVDHLQSRPDIDGNKLAYLGVSMGAAQGVINATLLQDRLKTAILLDGGFFQEPPPPGGDHADFAPRLKIPVLMVNGRYDYVFSVDDAQNPLFNMLGTPPADKRHVLLDTPHDVTEQRPQLVKSVLDWLDKYLGRVND